MQRPPEVEALYTSRADNSSADLFARVDHVNREARETIAKRAALQEASPALIDYCSGG